MCHSRPVFKSCPNWHKTAFKFQRISCTTCFTSPDTKETTPAGKGHACCLHVFMSCILSKAEAAGTKMEVSDCSERLHLKECRSLGSLGHPELQEISKRLKTVRPSVSHYLDELLIQKCKFGIQVRRHWPQLGLPQSALWHHVGVTIGITLD